MQKTYWKMFGAGVVAGTLYLFCAYLTGFEMLPAGYLRLSSDVLELLLYGLPLMVAGAIVQYSWQSMGPARPLVQRTPKEKVLLSAVFGLGAYAPYLAFLLAVFLFMRPQIG